MEFIDRIDYDTDSLKELHGQIAHYFKWDSWENRCYLLTAMENILYSGVFWIKEGN